MTSLSIISQYFSLKATGGIGTYHPTSMHVILWLLYGYLLYTLVPVLTIYKKNVVDIKCLLGPVVCGSVLKDLICLLH